MENERIKYTTCPLCESTKIIHTKTADCSKHTLYNPALQPTMRWYQCADCAHVFTEGYLSEEACDLIFSKTHENQKPGYDFERQRAVSAKIVDRVSAYSKYGVWLDVGFGNGSLLFTAEEWGYTPVGLDLRESSVKFINQLGFKAYCERIESFSSDDKITVISMADVLEHMPYPRFGLKAAWRLLDENGILFLSMPNYNCPAWRFLDINNANPYWGELEHYHNFSRKGLYGLLDDEGFSPINYNISDRYRVCMEVIAKKIT